ncbi:Uncharacterised protein [Mycobacteroides abscessus]|nr:Uncharacterised protein [Mycobacteroides abscessus]
MHHGLVADDAQDATARVQVAALGERDEALGHRAQALRLGLGGRDAAVLEELGGQVREHQALVSRSAAEPGALGGGRHGMCSLGSDRAAGADPDALRCLEPQAQYCCSVSENVASSSSPS